MDPRDLLAQIMAMRPGNPNLAAAQPQSIPTMTGMPSDLKAQFDAAVARDRARQNALMGPPIPRELKVIRERKPFVPYGAR